MINKGKLQEAAHLLLEAIEGNTKREGTQRTPERIAKGWAEMFDGYDIDLKDILGKTFSAEGYDQMIILADIKVESFCEHHVLPFRGKAWIGYLPKDKILGLSKFHKLVYAISHRLQNQERITSKTADSLMEGLECKGVIVVVKAFHDCMRLRGVRAVTGETITTAVRGVFAEDPSIKQEFFNAIWKK